MRTRIVSFFIFAALLVLALPGFAIEGFTGGDQQDYSEWKNRPHEDFTDGKAMFEKVKATLLKNYQDKKITEDDIYRAATEGMLANLEGRPWDSLLSPTAYTELKNDLTGEIVGIGVEIKFENDTGFADVLSVIPGTTAEKEGLKAGDEIIKVNGNFYKGKQLRDMVYEIRGRAGQSVRLTILRGDKIFTKTVTREKVVWQTVNSEVLKGEAGDVGVMTIGYFSNQTPPGVKEALEKFKTKNLKAIVIDLRDNQGGALDSMIKSADMLIPSGRTIVTTVKRDGGDELMIAKGAPLISENMPLEVLVDGETSSSAEILAASLKENLGARVIGEKTKGKWSAQSVEELPNKYAIKYTVSLFKTPQGEELEGKGLEPDVVVDMDKDKLENIRHLTDVDKRLAADVQLRTALNLVK